MGAIAFLFSTVQGMIVLAVIILAIAYLITSVIAPLKKLSHPSASYEDIWWDIFGKAAVWIFAAFSFIIFTLCNAVGAGVASLISFFCDASTTTIWAVGIIVFVLLEVRLMRAYIAGYREGKAT